MGDQRDICHMLAKRGTQFTRARAHTHTHTHAHTQFIMHPASSEMTFNVIAFQCMTVKSWCNVGLTGPTLFYLCFLSVLFTDFRIQRMLIFT